MGRYFRNTRSSSEESRFTRAIIDTFESHFCASYVETKNSRLSCVTP